MTSFKGAGMRDPSDLHDEGRWSTIVKHAAREHMG